MICYSDVASFWEEKLYFWNFSKELPFHHLLPFSFEQGAEQLFWSTWHLRSHIGILLSTHFKINSFDTFAVIWIQVRLEKLGHCAFSSCVVMGELRLVVWVALSSVTCIVLHGLLQFCEISKLKLQSGEVDMRKFCEPHRIPWRALCRTSCISCLCRASSMSWGEVVWVVWVAW